LETSQKVAGSRTQEEDVLILKKSGALVAALLLFPQVGCVQKSTHNRTLAELSTARADREEMAAEYQRELARRDDREARLQGRIDGLQVETDRLIEELGTSRRESLRVQEQLAECQMEIERARNLVDVRGAEAQRLRGRLDQLAAIEEEVRERNRIYEEVLGRFRSLIDAGRLSVSIVRGRMVINLPQDILFAPGSASLGRDGRETLSQIASVLSEFSDRTFQVEGHTDDDPISTAQFPSNWELSAARALSVVKLLVDRGVSPELVSGAGYGEFQPVATNETEDGQRLNRRIEIVMLPNLDVIAQAEVGG
jgi:chemotaxis protein MotB